MGAFADILPVMLHYATVLGCLFVAFAIAGIQAFAGDLDPTNPAVAASSYGIAGYTSFNFDTLQSALSVGLYMLIQNDWPVIFDALVAVRGRSAILFYVAFWLVNVVLALNVLVAFIIDSFTAQRTKRERLAAVRAHTSAEHLGVEDWRALIAASGVDLASYRISRPAHHFDVYDEVYKRSVRGTYIPFVRGAIRMLLRHTNHQHSRSPPARSALCRRVPGSRRPGNGGVYAAGGARQCCAQHALPLIPPSSSARRHVVCMYHQQGPRGSAGVICR